MFNLIYQESEFKKISKIKKISKVKLKIKF